MAKLELLSAALIATASLATPAMARTSHESSRYRARGANASAFDGRVGIPAASAGAFPAAPPDGEKCDVGDNPRIC